MYRTAIFILSANVARYAAQLGIFALLARQIGSAGAGAYVLSLAITTPIFIVAGLGVRTVYLTLRLQLHLAHYERLRGASVVVGMAVSLAASLVFRETDLAIIAAVACTKALDSYNEFYVAVLQKAGRAEATILTSGVVSAMQFGAFAITLHITGSAALALAASAAFSAGAMVGVVRRVAVKAFAGAREYGRPAPVDRPWRSIARAGLLD